MYDRGEIRVEELTAYFALIQADQGKTDIMKRKDINKNGYIIKTVINALDVLEQFNNSDGELGITELGQRLQLQKNKVFRILATLENRKYIEQNKCSDNYRLGINTLKLGQTLVKQMGLLRQARPVLEELKHACNETACLSVMRNFNVIDLAAVETDLPVRVMPRIGTRAPFHCTTAGKVLAAHVAIEDLRDCLNRTKLQRFTTNTIHDPVKLLRQLQLVARQGYAIDDEEFDVGVRGVGAPILDYRKTVIGAVFISGPANRFSSDRIENELIPKVIKSAEVISTRLGYSLSE